MFFQTMTPAKQERFLDVLGQTGNVQKACDLLELSRSTLYHRRRNDAEFAAKWDMALQMQVDELRQVVVRTVIDLMPTVVKVPLTDRDGNTVLDEDFEPIMVATPAGGDMDLLRSVASRTVFPENRNTNVQINNQTNVQTALPRRPKLVTPSGAPDRPQAASTASSAVPDIIDAEVIQAGPDAATGNQE